MLVCSVGTHEVWASEDVGNTWRAFEPFGGTSNGDCDVAVGQGGEWYVVFAHWSGPAGDRDLSVALSRDRGATWEEHAVKPPGPLTRHCPVPPYGACVAHRPWLHAIGDELYLTYFGAVPGVLFFQKSTDGGATWLDPVILAADARSTVAGDMTVTDDGRTIHVPIARQLLASLGGTSVWYEVATSTNGGASWTTQVVARPMDAHLVIPSMARAVSGELYFAIPRGNGSKAEMSVAVSRDEGATWSGPMTVASGVEFNSGLPYLALDAAPGGGVVAAWNGWVEGDGKAGLAARVAKLDALASELVQWTLDVTEPGGKAGLIEFFELRHDPEGRIHLVFPLPERPCPGTEHRDCIYHVVENATFA